MPELPEILIMSDFINKKSENKFCKIFQVEKGNKESQINLIEDEKYLPYFILESNTNGKELILNLQGKKHSVSIHIFMGMSGNWKYIPTEKWNETKFIRLRIDDITGNSLILHGGYMGPKYSFGSPFKGTKRGPDPTKDFDKFKNNILDNITNKAFDKPIYEVLLNQKYFNGIGNYLRSSIIFYLDENPFQSAREVIKNRPEILDMCRDIPLKSYKLNGGQLRDWSNPFNVDSKEFHEWVFYKKGNKIKDSNNRTFWYDPKWENNIKL